MSSCVNELARFLREHRALVLTGAGCSTESGIPDYRGNGRSPRTTVQHRAFVGDAMVRKRYWARSFAGWPRIAEAQPNAGHRALAALEASGHIAGLVTQNVDGLHDAAGTQRVVELHGALRNVRCLDCYAFEPRAELQRRLCELNPAVVPRAYEADGDASIEDADDFVVADCLHCGGVLKPDVVFFGDNVAREKLAAAMALFEEANALVVIGSSLQVFSGYRFVLRAVQANLPIAIVNLGPTRGDPHATVRVTAPAGETLEGTWRALNVDRASVDVDPTST
jgi:NAD-dependent SIR2 family protein deacetylase